MKKLLLRILFFILIITLNIGLDQATKYFAKTQLMNAGYVYVVGDIFVMKYVVNDGAFLSIFSGFPKVFKMIFLGALPFVVLTLLFIYSLSSKKITRLHMVGYACIIGGGLSNLIDRIFNNGFVIDFLNFGIGGMGSRFRTGILNIADLSITAGIIILLLAFRNDTKHEKQVPAVKA